MHTRREFLRYSVAAVSAASLAVHATSAETNTPLGVQLYTVRKDAERDLPRVLAQVRAIGYEKVETYWNVYAHPAGELRRMIADAGLRAPSGHFDYAGLPAKLDYARELGVQYVICPMLPAQLRTPDGFRQAAARFNDWGQQAQKLGIRFGFHNHNYEFRSFGATTGWDILLQNTDPELVCLELDCYWVTQAGRDPIQLLQKLGKRVRMVHLKDRKPGFPYSQKLNSAAHHFTEVGMGTIAWPRVLEVATEIGVEHLFVEQDETERPPIESLRISYQNLQKLVRSPAS